MNRSEIKKIIINSNDSRTSSTFAPTYNSIKDHKKVEENEFFKAITILSNRLDSLENENKILHNELDNTRTRENKLLNRFSWLILIINYSMVIFIIMSLLLFFDSFYPFIKKMINDSDGAKIIIGTIGTAISGGIIGLWCTFNKYVNKVIEREKKQ